MMFLKKYSHVNSVTVLKLLLTICLFTVTKIAAQTHTSPWDTPLDELKIVLRNISVCENISFVPFDIEFIERQWQGCIIDFLPSVVADESPVEEDLSVTDEEQENQFYAYFCRDPVAYKKCWVDVLAKLNECTPHRGDTSALIYFSMYDYSCINNGTDIIENRIKASETENLCEHNYATENCTISVQEWYSVDKCRRFLAQRKCDDSSLAQCTNTKHKEFSEQNLNHIQRSLGCCPNANPTQDAVVIVNSSSTIKIHSENYTLLTVLSGLMTFLLQQGQGR